MSSPLVDCELRPFYLFRIILIVLTFHLRVQSVKFLTRGTIIGPIFLDFKTFVLIVRVLTGAF